MCQQPHPDLDQAQQEGSDLEPRGATVEHQTESPAVFMLALISGFCPHQAVGGIDGLVSLSTLCVHKFSIDEELMRHFYGHVVDALFHLSKLQKCKTQKWTSVTITSEGFVLQQPLHLHNPPPALLLHPLL